MQFFFINFTTFLKMILINETLFLFLLAARATICPICAKNIVSQYFAKKICAHLKCIQKLRRIKKVSSKNINRSKSY